MGCGGLRRGGGIRINVSCIQSSDGINAEEVYEAITGVPAADISGLPPAEEFDFAEEMSVPLIARLRREESYSSGPTPAAPNSVTPSDIRALLDLFKEDNAKTCGSLIRIPDGLSKKLLGILESTVQVGNGDDLNRRAVAEQFSPIVEQALILGRLYDAVVANPPYMGSGQMAPELKQFVRAFYPEGTANLFGSFVLRSLGLARRNGHVAMITLSNWLFLSDYEELRQNILFSSSIVTLIDNGRGVWGSDFESCAFVLCREDVNRVGTFRRLFRREREVQSNSEITSNFFDENQYPASHVSRENFKAIPGEPIAFWLSPGSFDVFRTSDSLSQYCDLKVGLQTGDNAKFLRLWHEVNFDRISFRGPNEKKWYPYCKGGPFRRWYGNTQHVVEWTDNGYNIKNFRDAQGKLRSYLRNTSYYFRESVEWSDVGQSVLGARYRPEHHHFDVVAMSAFRKKDSLLGTYEILSFLNSSVAAKFMNVLAPGMHYNTGYVAKLPIRLNLDLVQAASLSKEAVNIAREDWTAQETTWDFEVIPLLSQGDSSSTLEDSWFRVEEHIRLSRSKMASIETENNHLWINALGLGNEMPAEASVNIITLAQADRKREVGSLVSYAIGCMMGRYSLDRNGLVYARSENSHFDPSSYTTFPADVDGIIPLTDYEWYVDDATNRFVEFIATAWPRTHLEENLHFVAESLASKQDEPARDTIRRYLSTGFYKDHLQTYKRRPIYWLFSSGKQRAFLCLVYLHRYNEGTLARMRTDYVIPLQGKLAARIDHLAGDIEKAGSTSHRKKLEKERDTLVKQQAELFTFDERLRHYADKKIHLDLDDGVKVNYGKFGDLLAEVKAVTGGSEE